MIIVVDQVDEFGGDSVVNQGVRFLVVDDQLFASLKMLFAEIKRDKDEGRFRDCKEWLQLVPDSVKAKFHWPTAEEREHWLGVRDTTPIRISALSQQFGAMWDFYRVFEALEDGDYNLIGCEMIEGNLAEMRIEPGGYPYGGVGPLIALAEAFGFEVVGVNECGRYESRDELLRGR